MTVLTRPDAPTHSLHGAQFTALATPSRGSRETAVWQVEIAPGMPAQLHQLTREEVFIVLSGTAQVVIDHNTLEAHAGDAIVVPPHTDFAISNAGQDSLRALCVMPVGGEALIAGRPAFRPPWSL